MTVVRYPTRNVPFGAVFPPNPATGQVFYHTTHNAICYWDGTRWLGPSLTWEMEQVEAADGPFGGTADILFSTMFSDRAIYIQRAALVYLVLSGSHSASHYYDIKLYRNTAADGYDACITFTTNKSTVGSWVKATDLTSFTNNPLNATDRFVKWRAEATGSPGPLHVIVRVRYAEVYT